MGSRIRSRSRIRPLLGIVIATHTRTHIVEWILQKASDPSGAFAFCAGVLAASSTLAAAVRVIPNEERAPCSVKRIARF